MTQFLDKLRDMLKLEQRDFDYQDKCVYGGLARYADTWLRLAVEALGEAQRPWAESVAERMRAYSAMSAAERPQAAAELEAMLAVGPEEHSAPHETPKPSTAPAPPARTARPTTDRGLNAPVSMIPNIGPKWSALLAKLGVQTIRDFLYLLPRRYEDFSTLKTISQLRPDEAVSVLGTVWDAGGRETRSGRYFFRAILSDATGTLEAVWYNARFLENQIRPDMQLLLSGKVELRYGRLTMVQPEREIVGRGDLTNARIQPIYPLTEGLSQRKLRIAMERALKAWAQRVPDPLPEGIRREHNLLPLARALWGVHLPDDKQHLLEARRRLAFEETLYLQLGLLRHRRAWKSEPGRVVAADEERLASYRAALPFELTAAQARSLDEMLRDMASGEPMNRLLQGDVGSGKTAVAALSMALVAAQGMQAAMMAPTELLAEQHYKGLRRLFDAFPEPRPTMALLTGNVTGAEREAVYQGLADGTIQVAVGTHALIQEAVEFRDLALVVIDEQHRFGVQQRSALRQKGFNPHLLVMTATPIPRSLELTVWGHLDISVLDEMPPGRQPIKTHLVGPTGREAAYGFIRQQVEKGHQAFVIYPLVESSDKIEARAAVDEYERLKDEVFPDLRLGLLHGRMRAEEKDEVMAQFVRGELDVLVATSVVEVGIDVPNATVMLIDGAERFGLAQLHQFRGRVGRGDVQSYCILLSESTAPEAQARLEAVVATNDGFVLAEKDLEMRGPGEFLGTQQSGFPALPMAMAADMRMLHTVRQVAARILEEDPELTREDHRLLAERLADFWDTAGDLS